MKNLFLIIFILSYGHESFAWGMLGHRITAEIAEENISENTRKKIKTILGSDSLAKLSNYPDYIKSDPEMRKKYSSWHYISFKKSEKLEKVMKKDSNHILGGIEYFKNALVNKKSSKEEKWFAMAFLVHLIGDIHQPLHIGYAKDRGGNNKKVKWFGEKTNLHVIWDERLIQMQELSYTEYAKELNHVSKKDKKEWQNSKPVEWANESRMYLPKTYSFKEGKYWEYEYNYKHIKFLNERLLKGGIRLAGLLDDLLS